MLDGARPDVLENLALNGDLPNFKKLFFDQGQYTKAVSVFPSTTGPAYLPFLTGKTPGECNIPGIRWLDRASFAKNPHSTRSRRSYVGYESFFLNRDLNPSIQTIFQKIQNGFSIASLINTGAVQSKNIYSYLHPLSMFVAKLTHAWSMVDHMTYELLSKAIDRNHPFIFASFLSIDELSHLTDPFSPKTIAIYKQLDQKLAALVLKLKSLGKYDDTLILSSADHGLTQTKRHLELYKVIEDAGLKTFYYPNIFRTNVQAACMVSGNAFANVYVKSMDGWDRPSFESDFQATGLLSILLSHEEIDHIIYRKAINHYVVSSLRGSCEFKVSGKTIVDYKVTQQDPLELPITPLSLEQSFEVSFNGNYPDAIFQIHQLFQSPRCGDLLVCAKLGCDLRKRFEIPEHYASHGSLHKEHMLVPLMSSSRSIMFEQKRTSEIFNVALKALL